MTDILIADKLEVVFTHYSKKRMKGGDKIQISFLINPADIHEQLAHVPLGEILNLQITKPEIGV